MRLLSKTYSECQDGNRGGSCQAWLPLNPHSAQPLSNPTSCTHEIHSNLGLPPREAYIATAFQQTGTWWCIQLAVTPEDSPSWPFRLRCHILQQAEMLNGLLSCALLLWASCEDYNILPSKMACFKFFHLLSALNLILDLVLHPRTSCACSEGFVQYSLFRAPVPV